MLQRFIPALCCSTALLFTVAAPAQQPRDEAPLPQPQNLLVTPTLSNWRAVWHPDFRRNKLADHYQLQNNVLHVTGGTNGAIVTIEQFQDFTLKFQWRWAPGSEPGGNGGVMVHTQPSRGPLFVTGIEIQLRDGEAGDLYGVGVNAMGRDRRAQQGNRILRRAEVKGEGEDDGESIERPIGEWNQAVVTCIDDQIRVRINGTLVNEAARLSRTSGRIAIQAEDQDIQFQHVEVTRVTEATPQGDPIDLFNGENLHGWSFDISDADTPPQDIWTVQDGVIHHAGHPHGVMRTENSYENYLLTVEWRWAPAPSTPGSAPESTHVKAPGNDTGTIEGGHAGVLLHSTQPRQRGIWPRSIASQLASGHAGDLWTIGVEATIEDTDPPSRIQSKRRRVNLTDDSERPLGQWNQKKIYVIGDTLRVFVNGDLVNEAWELTHRKGAICLQAEGGAIQYRKIQLQPMSKK